MKKVLFLLIVTLASCSPATDKSSLEIEGTWKLFEATLEENGVKTVTKYDQNTSFIKIINKSHFAFLLHDLSNGKDSTAVYSSGGGTYELVGNKYTENLEYCTDRQWEGNDFHFTLEIINDTLIQSGVEIVEEAGVNRMNTEKYIKVN
ncbi:hypothetical protein [Arcticibacterium luteifluviistationis]|uniref:Lipocalin-like domain-containing protein n=1 Tax=Arcticibacterium luteifluviistationis TaxID=1784714 RepID=A0A2Z4GGR8_9BACT|nr:hypothetical protein [Arcticibacterium luteifluviistationis]AWW00278.1 hypothetical protein DJ013_19715 [Arcticibacterium luteifluviistationis]